MYKATVNDKVFDVNPEEIKSWDIQKINERTFHILKDNQSFNVELVQLSEDGKEVQLKVNQSVYTVAVQTHFDLLLKEMGLEGMDVKKINEIKAPMPGLVIKALVSVGDSVQKGDGLLVLEAMKMENVIKSPGEGIVKSIQVNPTDAVEKNQVLIVFE